VQLKGTGNSVAAVLGTSNGRVDLLSRGGAVSNLALEVAGADIGEIARFFLGGDKEIQLRCGVAAFSARDGVLTAEALVVDTDDTYLGGEGTISLKEETLDLRIVPLPKDVSILSIRGPLRLRGTFAKPQVGLEKRSLARKIGMAVMLGLINPLAALIPTIETAPGKDKEAPCADLVQSLQANIKGGAKKPVPQQQKKQLEKNIEKEK
jgi:AsmA family protein